jgi:hypothetical protein
MDSFDALTIMEDSNDIIWPQTTQLSSQHKAEDQYSSSHSIPMDSERLEGAATIGMCIIA